MRKIYFLLLTFSLFTNANAQIVNIPDANFKAKLLAANTTNSIAKNLSGAYFKIDTNNDGQIQESEALNVSYLDVSYSYTITSLEGIEKFTNLKTLYCGNNQLISINIAGLTNIQNLYCGGNKLTSLDIKSLTKLEILDCNFNDLTSLNASGLLNLQSLNCGINRLTSLNLNGLASLKTLDLSINHLPSLDLTSLTSLESLSCYYNQLSALDVTSLKKLKSLTCGGNLFTSLNLNGLINLTYLDCNFNIYGESNEFYGFRIPISFNKLTSLNVVGLTNLQRLYYSDNQITSLDLSKLINLTNLFCSGNGIVNLDVSNLSKLTSLDCSNNPISNIDVSKLINLTSLNCSSNGMINLDVSNLIKLYNLNCSTNQISNLDISKLKSIGYLNCSNNKITTLDIVQSIYRDFNLSKNLLESLFIKNNNIYEYINFSENPNLKYICVDEKELVSIQKKVNDYGYANCQVNSYCSFVPGGIFYNIQGNQKLDSNNNGCDVNDVLMPNLKYAITSGTTTGSIISDISGNYSIPVQTGTHTIKPVIENPSYFSVSPTTVNITFPTQTSPFTQNFCITPNGVRPDLEVTLLQLQPARPGFDAKYKLVYKNKGNTMQSGAVKLTFNDAVLDFVIANTLTSTQSTNTLSWNFTTLQPFENREITFTMNVNSPMETPAVNNGDILNFTTTITSSATDETPIDNTFTLNQTVVGSYDPNDKTCLEGSVITPALIGQYVHYMIRFENTGTFAAENVVIKDMIDLSKFDISTLIPTSASHSYVTKISDGNKVEFIFENINLPFDDANNDGYIAFKIKTKPTLVVNDSFTNEANIYFDYNFPILTNKATSTFKTLDTHDFDFVRYFTLYPNPAKKELNITAKEIINVKSMSVYNTLGQLVLVVANADKVSKIDVSSLTSGNYFIKINSDKGTSNARFIKE